MLDADAPPFLQAIQALEDNYYRVSAAGSQYTTAMIVFGIMALVCLLLLGIQLIRDAHAHTEEVRRRELESRERNRRNQDSILKLLDEMSDLAEGDLTAFASVTEDITGAIADAFNYAIDALRHLVARIDSTAEAVAEIGVPVAGADAIPAHKNPRTRNRVAIRKTTTKKPAMKPTPMKTKKTTQKYRWSIGPLKRTRRGNPKRKPVETYLSPTPMW